MILSELWHHYEADKRIQGLSPNTLKAYALQLKMLVTNLGDIDISEVTLNLLKGYLAKQADRLKPSSLGHRIRFVSSLYRFAFEETYLASNPSLKLREREFLSFDGGRCHSSEDLMSVTKRKSIA
ncbi:site-specific integrase [Paenibacillus aestuarii]|uniref:Site-specific integrase n=1 Tax=Paenibacillus aestuarii TaxID=516965 RepID=A0ABW0K278_9BACL|nr:site-specific integrase [Paenibacillus aestuarii]